MMPKVTENILYRQYHENLQENSKSICCNSCHVCHHLNAAVFQIMNLNIIFIMKRLFGTVKYFQNYSNSDKRWFYWSCNLANLDFAELNSAEILKLSGSNQRRTNKNLTEGIPFCSVCKNKIDILNHLKNVYSVII